MYTFVQLSAAMEKKKKRGISIMNDGDMKFFWHVLSPPPHPRRICEVVFLNRKREKYSSPRLITHIQRLQERSFPSAAPLGWLGLGWVGGKSFE